MWNWYTFMMLEKLETQEELEKKIFNHKSII